MVTDVYRILTFIILRALLVFHRVGGSEGPVAVPDQVGEYCQLETMRGRCRWKSEVIVMTSARWGRMKTGRCLNIHPNFITIFGQDPLFLGCFEDVISIADRKCSGRSECDIRIPNTDLDSVTPCYPDQKSYLEASYTCVKVVQESRSCVVSVTGEQQFISRSISTSSDASSLSSCGSRSNPWHLEAPLGQRINISLIDFSGAVITQRVRGDVTCHQYGYVVEKSNKRNVSICAEAAVGGARPQRETEVYSSETNTLDVVLFGESTSDSYNFLVKLNAVGCTNMIPPDNAWLKRSNNDIVIGCYLSQQTWQLKCDGHEWKGLVGECDESYVENKLIDLQTDIKVVSSEDSKSKMFLAMVVIAGGAVIACIAVITVGVVCLQKCKNSYRKSGYKSTNDDDKLVAVRSQCPPTVQSI